MSVKPYAHPQPEKALKHLIYLWHGHGMQYESFYSLTQSIVTCCMVCTLASGRISANSHKSGEVSVVVMVWMWSHMPIHNLRRCSTTSYMYHMDVGCSLRGFYSLNQSVVAWFADLHQVGFHPTPITLGKCLWWYQCECEAIWSTTWEGAQTPHVCITWMWDAAWKVLQPQPKHSGMVCTLASGKISANSHKSGKVSVVVMVLVWSLMPIHNLRRHSNTL